MRLQSCNKCAHSYINVLLAKNHIYHMWRIDTIVVEINRVTIRLHMLNELLIKYVTSRRMNMLDKNSEFVS